MFEDDTIPDTVDTTESVTVNGPALFGIVDAEGDHDWFRVSLIAGADYQFNLNSADFGGGGVGDAYLGLFDSNGEALGWDDDSGGNMNSQIQFNPSITGTYFLSASGYSSRTGGYSLTATTPDDYAGSSATTGTVTVNGSASTGLIDIPADQDWFRVSLNAGTRYQFRLNSADNGGVGDAYLRLLDSGGTQLAGDDDSGGNGNALVNYTPSLSGTYFLSAQGYSNHTGAYILNAIMADDYAGGPSTTGSVSVNGGASSGRIEIAADQDWFQVNLVAGGAYEFHLDSATTDGVGDPYLRLLDASQVQVAANDDGPNGLNSAISYAPAVSGVYYLSAQGLGNRIGAYTLSATRNIDDFTATPATTGRVAVNGNASTGEIEVAADQDWFSVSLTAGTAYRFRLDTAAVNGVGDAYLRLLNNAGTQLAVNDDGGGNGNSQIDFTPGVSGTYLLSAQGYSDRTGAYALSAATVDDYAGTTGTSASAAVGGSPSTGRIEVAADQDWFRVSLNAGTTYQFNLNSAASDGVGDAYLRLLNGSGTLLAADDDSGGNGNALLRYTPNAAGTYFLSAQGYGSNTGAYALTTALVDDYAATTATAGRVTVNNGLVAVGTIDTAADQDWFRVSLNAGTRYQFRLNSADSNGVGDAYLRLLNSASGQLAVDDDAGGDGNALITFTPSVSGSFFLSAQGYASRTGAYTLAATTADDYAASTLTTGSVGINASASRGQIETTADQDWFRVNLQAGIVYEFQLNATASGGLSDPYLRLLTSGGTQVANDDDGRSGLNSLISFAPAVSGAYYLSAQGLGDAHTGAYTLSATRSAADFITDADGAFSADAEAGGVLAATDSINPTRSGSYMDRHSLSGVTDGTLVRVYMGESGFDDYLQIERGGAILASDDDSGAGTDAYLSWTFQSGDVIRATSYSAGAVGTYSLYVDTSTAATPVLAAAGAIIGSNAAPTFLSGIGVQGTITDTPRSDNFQTLTGTVTATDTADATNDQVGYSVTDGNGVYGSLSINAANGNWTFVPNAATIQRLGAESRTQSFTVRASDGVQGTAASIDFLINGANDAPTGTVTISGRPAAGQTLTASNTLADAEGMGRVSYQWLRNGGEITGASGNTYLLAPVDVGKDIAVRASYTDGGGTPEQMTSSAVALSNQPGVTITPQNGTETREDGSAVSLAVRLDSQPTPDRPVTLNFASTDNTEGTVGPASLTFNSTNWNVPQTVVVSGVQDYAADGTVAYAVTTTISTLEVNYARLIVPAVQLMNAPDLTSNAPKGTGYGNYADRIDRDLFQRIVPLNPTDNTVLYYGLDGPDRIYGGYAMSDLRGGIGDDRLYGEQDDDILEGGAGNDFLDGGVDDDRLLGETGDDTLEGGTGVDTLSGGPGNDTYILGYDTKDIIIDNGLASDRDTVVMPYMRSYTLPSGIENGVIPDNIPGASLAGNGANNELTGNTDANTLNGGVGNDILNGDGGNDYLIGGVGADTLYASDGNDVVDAGDGNDQIIGGDGAGNDTYRGGPGIDTVRYTSARTSVTVNLLTGRATGADIGNDTLTDIENAVGGQGNDLITGNNAANDLDGYSGNDTLDGGAGNDTTRGGAGDDLFHVRQAGDLVVEAANAGNDTAYSYLGSYTLAANVEEGRAIATGAANLTGNALNNVLYASAGNNVLNGGAGSDTASYRYAGAAIRASLLSTVAQATGGSGADTLVGMENLTGSNFNDTLTGNGAANILEGGLGNDSLDGGLGIDTAAYRAATATVSVNLAVTVAQATGGAGTDTLRNIENLTGSAFADRLTGNAGANVLDGGAGADTMAGGNGSDTYIVDNPRDVVTETNSVASTGGTDRVQSSVTLTLGANLEQLVLTGSAAISGNGNALNNGIYGNSGANRLDGAGGNDVISGGAGGDTLLGGVGNDTLVGGAGNDSCTGGAGNDVFKFVTRTDGVDRLTDFQSGSDKLQVVSANFGLAVGALAANRFVAAGTTLTSTAAVFIYNAGTGALSFDSNGNGAGGISQIAMLTGSKTLRASDIQVVAA